MSTRIRTKGSQASFIGRATVRSRHRQQFDPEKDWIAWPDWSNAPEWTYRGFNSYESMTDEIGSPGMPHEVEHVKIRNNQDVPVGTVMYEMETVAGGIPWQHQINAYVPLNDVLYNKSSHLGTNSGIKALAIARVPAYHQATVEGFVSLMEAREIANTGSVKAAAALGRFAFTAYKTVRGKGLKALPREGKQALETLLGHKANMTTARKGFETLLTAMLTVNSANMEWKYGWKPMLKDIQAFNEMPQKLMNLRQKLLDGVRVYGRAMDVRTSSFSEVGQGVRGDDSVWGSWYHEGTKTTTTTAVASVVRKLNPSSSMYDVDWFNSLDVVMELNGLKPTLSGSWELLPMTFISDWFWNVSNLLESLQGLSSPVGTSFTSTGSMYSVKTETVVKGSIATPSYKNGKHTYVGVCTRTNYSRTLDPLTGGPAFYVPPVHLPTKVDQWWSMAQIAFQTLVGKNR